MNYTKIGAGSRICAAAISDEDQLNEIVRSHKFPDILRKTSGNYVQIPLRRKYYLRISSDYSDNIMAPGAGFEPTRVAPAVFETAAVPG